ncbi:alginate export family protein [Methylobacterium haplocladii]|uniref:alginate export family protein n=1 Tax=Methylobacterium haplocladii TaxID=1176176 RepID=UPI0011BDADA9|nr:hypothetical protein GCM10007887_21460 [Methylobacterium haplocladii]
MAAITAQAGACAWSRAATRLTVCAALFGAVIPAVAFAQAASGQGAPAKPASTQVAPGQQLKQTPYFALYEALGKPDGWKISGTIRPRYDGLGGQFRPSPSPATNDLFSMQMTLFAEYDTGPVRIGGEIFDSRAYFQRRNSNSIATTEVNALELGQAYLGFDLEDAVGAGTVSTLTVGRFTQNIGSRRLIARNQFRNTINAFTGIAYDFQNAEKDKLRLFYTLPHYRLPDDRAGILSNSVEWDHEGFDAQLFGGIFTKANVLGGILEAYGYGFLERDDGTQLEGIQTRDRRLFTPGFRLFRAPKAGQFDHELEAIYQTGIARNTTAVTDVTDVPVSAYFVHAEAGYTFDVPWVPRLSLHYDHASGDGRSDGSYNRFDTLFGARRFDYGPTSLYGAVQRANLISPSVRLEISPNADWDFYVDYRGLWLEDPTDSFASTGVRDRTGQSGRFAGQQIETRARHWLVPRSVLVDAGVAYLIKGSFLENAPNAPRTGDTIYGYLTTTFFF